MEPLVDLAVSGDDGASERLLGDMVVGGYSGLAIAAEQVVACRTWGSGSSKRLNQIVGELVPAVARVIVRLNDGTELEAQIVRTEVVPNDHFVAF